MIKKEKIDKIIKKPIKSSYSLKNINKDEKKDEVNDLNEHLRSTILKEDDLIYMKNSISKMIH